MKGKIVLITGATSGIGRETAIGLAKLGGTIVFTARNLQLGEITKAEIVKKTDNSQVDFLHCDLASFDSIRSCCNEFKTRYEQLHVLINNAGIWNSRRRESKDGIEETLAVNYLAPFLMTNLLLEVLKKSSPSRIINVSSQAHRGKINFDDLEFKKSYSGWKAYSQSKLAIILFTRLLAKKLEGTGVTVNSVHPGMVATNLGRDSNIISRLIFRWLGRDPEKGAETTIYLASSPEVENITGEYFADNKIKQSSGESGDMAIAEKLWDASAKYVHMVSLVSRRGSTESESKSLL